MKTNNPRTAIHYALLLVDLVDLASKVFDLAQHIAQYLA